MSKPHPRRRKPDSQVPGLPVRRAALRLLDAVTRRGEPLEVALHAAAQGLTGADRSLVHAIAADVLRWAVDLDVLIDGATEKLLPPDAKARMVLRMALVQTLRLDTPPHAAIATALPLVDGGPRKLVHGVFGTLHREGATLPESPTLPAAAAERWHAQWGETVVQAASRALGRRAPIDLCFADPADVEGFVAATGAVSLAPGHARVDAGATVPDLPGYDEGGWWVQDIAVSLPARLAGSGEGRAALDLCAAPGGKTMQLAAQGWRVTAVDKSAKRLERLARNLDRAKLPADVRQGDALEWDAAEPVDLVLLDAPCSATGIFRRHPDVLHRAGTRQIVEMAEMQAQMLDRAALWVKPGGMLIYATCSLEQAEGEQQIPAFQSRHPDFAPATIRPEQLVAGIVPTVDHHIRTLPDMLEPEGGLDGFFVACLTRTG